MHAYQCNLYIISLQAYRLEPLVNSAYERVKPVKIDRCNAGPSGTAQELACGPRTETELEPPLKKGGWMSYISSMAKVSAVASETALNTSTTANNMDKKVCIYQLSKCLILPH